MSEKVSPKPPPPKPPTTTGTGNAARPTSFSSSRMAAVKTAEPPKSTGERLKAFFADLGLNIAAVLKELAQDFKNSDRFFKFKLLIIALWLATSVTGFVVACPGSVTTASNSLDAKLTVTQVAGDKVYSLKNMGEDPWTEITVTANGNYMLAAPRVEPNEMLTFEIKRLTGPNGAPAPKDLAVQNLVLKTADGKSELIKDGEVVE